MKHVLLLATALAVLGTAPATAGVAPFGCNARAPDVCYFRIFYTRGSRDVILPAGMKQNIPDVDIGKHQYCASVNARPIPKCRRQVIKATPNN